MNELQIPTNYPSILQNDKRLGLLVYYTLFCTDAVVILYIYVVYTVFTHLKDYLEQHTNTV